MKNVAQYRCTIIILKLFKRLAKKIQYLPFYCSSKSSTFLVSSQYFIITETMNCLKDDEYSRVTITNRSDGLLESSFVILDNFEHMQLYLDKFLLTFDEETCSLNCYNFKVDLLHYS